MFTGSWGIRNNWLGGWQDRVPTISKVYSVLWPGLIVGLLNITAVTDSVGGFIMAAYFTSKCFNIRGEGLLLTKKVFTSLTVGAILLVLILYKYVKTRRLVMGHSRRGRWWGSNSKDQSSQGTRDYSQNETVESGVATNTKRSIYDRALLTRFSIGFVILA